MAEWNNGMVQRGAATDAGSVAYVDEGLRTYMLRVYNYMAAGVALTGLVAYFVFTQAVTGDAALAAKASNGAALAMRRGMYLTEFGRIMYTTPLMWVVALAPLAFVFFLSFRVYKMSVAGAQLAFWLFAAVMGASLSVLLLKYTGTSIARVFFVTSAAFAGLSLWGYTTKRDLTGMGSFLIMGVIGLILASLVNIYFQSSAMQFAISAIGVLVFAGLTAYDTQQIKDGYYEIANDATLMAKGAIMGALNLYLDFINMFTSMLSLFGDRE